MKSISEGSTEIQKQFELLEVRVVGTLSYGECTVIFSTTYNDRKPKAWKRKHN